MSKAKVLIVEDERIIVRDLQNSLNELGYDVVGWAQDSVDALSKVKELKPDIVLMDIFIDGLIDGIETAKIIKTSYEVPVVFLTAFSDNATISRAKKVLPYAYLLKPFSSSELCAAIELSIYKFEQEREINYMNQQLTGMIELHIQNKNLAVEDELFILSGKASLFNTTPDALYVISPEGEILEQNHVANDLTGSLNTTIEENFYRKITPVELSFADLIAILKGKGSWSGRIALMKNPEKKFDLSLRRLCPGGACSLFLAFIHENVRSADSQNQQLEDVNQRMNILVKNLSNVVVYESGAGRDYASPNVESMLGFTLAEFKNHEFFWTLIHPDDFERINESSYRWYYQDTTDTWVESYRMKKADGSYIWVRDQMFQVKNNFGVKYKIGLLININDLVEKEQILLENRQLLQKTVNDKDQLIQEIHHRVRNNLQIITSLLNLQSTYVEDVVTQRIIQDSQNRVRALSLIHEDLYQSDDMTLLNLSDYLKRLGKQLYRSMRVDITRYKLDFDAEQLMAPVDIATPAGLIVNELLSNAFKHAFVSKETGYVLLKVRLSGENIVIAVTDNGVGLPGDFSIDKVDSLGLMLVGSLIEQVNGKITYSGIGGASFEVSIPLHQTTKTQHGSRTGDN